MTRYIITHHDQYGERHQLLGAFEAASPQEAIAQMLKEAAANDDGQWEAFEVTSEADIIK